MVETHVGTTEGAEHRLWQGTAEVRGNRGCGGIPGSAQQIQVQVAAAGKSQQGLVSRELSGSALGMHSTEKAKISGYTAVFKLGRY